MQLFFYKHHYKRIMIIYFTRSPNVMIISIDKEDESLHNTSGTTTLRVLSHENMANSALA
ncbi:MAG: hypothetical protein WA667_03840 [Candidatus Nitrosopolaris sp.]